MRALVAFAAALTALALAATALLGTGARGSASTAHGYWIAFHADPGSSGDLYVDSVDGSRRRRLTRFFGQVPTAVWSPDGKRLAMLSRSRGVQDLYLIRAGE
jgi:Tol biopolymer transport system component